MTGRTRWAAPPGRAPAPGRRPTCGSGGAANDHDVNLLSFQRQRCESV